MRQVEGRVQGQGRDHEGAARRGEDGAAPLREAGRSATCAASRTPRPTASSTRRWTAAKLAHERAVEPIDPGVDIGHVHLKVADVDRALDFYCGVLGFELHAALRRRRRLRLGRRLPPSHRPQHLGLEGRLAAAPGTTGLFHAAIRYPTRRSLADALRRLTEAGVPLTGASDHGVSEALYLDDPDGNGVELYWDRRARSGRSRSPAAGGRDVRRPLDLQGLLAELD